MAHKNKQYEDDDGRVICNMDVDGMRRKNRPIQTREDLPKSLPMGNQLTRSEARRYNWYAILAGLVVVSVFSITWVLFVLFCTQVWLR